MPEQYDPQRIQRAGVQALLPKVSVQPRTAFSDRFPDEMPCRVKITLNNGRVLEQESKDYEGFFTRPMSWDMAVQKFNKTAAPNTTESQRAAVVRTVANLEQVSIRELMQQLSGLGTLRWSGRLSLLLTLGKQIGTKKQQQQTGKENMGTSRKGFATILIGLRRAHLDFVPSVSLSNQNYVY
jgi:hypothetical protein